MNNFGFFFGLGWEHIISPDALDHLLFVFALTCIFLFSDWKKLLILITAFTIGHSLTLVLSVLDIIRVNSKLVEVLIPITIIITAAMNFWRRDSPKGIRQQYAIALIFGLIHGMGFANTIRFMLAKSENIAMPLLGFNLGLEAGQIFVVAIIIALGYLLVNIFKLKQKWWIYSISAVALVIAVNMVWDRLTTSEF